MKKLSTYDKNRRHISPFFTLLMRTGSIFLTTKERVKIVKNGYIPKPPYLLISNHGSFIDYAVACRATLPYHPHWVCSIEEFINKNWPFRALGVIAKRKFTNDPKSAQLMMQVLKDYKKILILYPEARYSFVGKPERIDAGLGKLVKLCDVPIVFLTCHGHFIRDPQWGDHKPRKISNMSTEMKCLISQKNVRRLSADEIDKIIAEQFVFDEEQYQLDNNIKNTYAKRAEGIERILYKCPHCGKEFEMSSSGTTFGCKSCGVQYSYNEDGTLTCLTGETNFSKVSDWYYWEKECTKKEVENGTYHFEDDVRLEHLEGTGVGFVPMKGKFHLEHSIKEGIKVIGEKFEYIRSSLQSYAIHIEYNYKHKGGCIDLATNTESYFAYPLNKPEWLTKIHFAVEAIYDYLKKQLKDVEKVS